MAKKNGKAVAAKQETALSTEAQGVWGGEELGNDDIIIPRALLMQPMSELVTDGIAKIGEFRDSMDKDKVLGTEKSPLEVVVFGSFKTWVEFQDGEFQRVVPCDATNAHWGIEEVTEAGVVTRNKVLNYYVLLPGDVAKGEAFPYVLACQRTSFRAGKQIATHIKKLAMFKKPAAAKVFQVKSVKTTNDKGTFFVMDVSVARDATNQEQQTAYEWHTVLAKSQVKVHEESEETTGTSQASASAEAAAAHF